VPRINREFVLNPSAEATALLHSIVSFMR